MLTAFFLLSLVCCQVLLFDSQSYRVGPVLSACSSQLQGLSLDAVGSALQELSARFGDVWVMCTEHWGVSEGPCSLQWS